MKPEFAINNEHGQVLALIKSGSDFVIATSEIGKPEKLNVHMWTRAELVAIRNQINKALQTRA